MLQIVMEIFNNILGSVREPLVVLDSDLKVVKANHSFYQTFNVKPDETEGILIYDLGNRQWDIPKLRELIEDILPQNSIFKISILYPIGFRYADSKKLAVVAGSDAF